MSVLTAFTKRERKLAVVKCGQIHGKETPKLVLKPEFGQDKNSVLCYALPTLQILAVDVEGFWVQIISMGKGQQFSRANTLRNFGLKLCFKQSLIVVGQITL